jgi:hypothetical protein
LDGTVPSFFEEEGIVVADNQETTNFFNRADLVY